MSDIRAVDSDDPGQALATWSDEELQALLVATLKVMNDRRREAAFGEWMGHAAQVSLALRRPDADTTGC